MIPDVDTDVSVKTKASPVCETAIELMPLHNLMRNILFNDVNAVIT